MRQKIIITGAKVHDVGYRSFLMTNALRLGLVRFHARNRSGEQQEVVALAEGDDETIEDFKELVKTQRPEHAGDAMIKFEPYEGDVPGIGEYAQVFTAEQLEKAIPLLLEIRDNTNMIRGDTNMIRGDTNMIRGDTSDIPEIKDDIKGLRTDLIKRSDARLARMEKDIRTIKSKLGLR